jgi:hypothetical protein
MTCNLAYPVFIKNFFLKNRATGFLMLERIYPGVFLGIGFLSRLLWEKIKYLKESLKSKDS